MRGKLLLWTRKLHLFIGVFFTPLLLLFVISGWWQMTVSSDDQEKEGGRIHEMMKSLSSVHTSATWPRAGVHHGEWMMKILVVSMCVGLILSILLGLTLAWQLNKKKGLILLALVLGIVTPVLLLYLA